ncbi:MAG: DHH family phosphoesterase [Actinomycetota bacterium]
MTPETMARAAEILRDADEVAIACHINPDPDALGSMLGLSAFLRTRGVSTVCSFPNEPLEIPRWLQPFDISDALVEPSAFPDSPPLMVTCDCASLDRLGRLAAASARAGELIWIDHHVSNEGLGTVPVIDPAASSTAEMVFRLTREIGGDLPTEAAALFYAGLVTDTGRFQYEAVRPETLRIAADLREYGFDHARLVQILYEDNGIGYLKLVGTALERLRREADADLVWTYLTQADLAAASVDGSETDDLIDVIRTAREADVAALVKQQRDGLFKVSMRSRGGHDLATVASGFGGGGHRLASGYTSVVGLAETVEQLTDALRSSNGGA